MAAAVRHHRVFGLGFLLIVGLTMCLPGCADGDWEAWHDYGRWRLAEDRGAIETERTLRCNDEHRAEVIDTSGDVWLVGLERRANDGFCNLAGCLPTEGVFGCGPEVALPETVPIGVDVRLVCEPGESTVAATAEGGVSVTLPPASGGQEAVACSPTAEDGHGP